MRAAGQMALLPRSIGRLGCREHQLHLDGHLCLSIAGSCIVTLSTTAS